MDDSDVEGSQMDNFDLDQRNAGEPGTVRSSSITQRLSHLNRFQDDKRAAFDEEGNSLGNEDILHLVNSKVNRILKREGWYDCGKPSNSNKLDTRPLKKMKDGS